MSVSKVGTSYTSFSYLEREQDYRAFDLASQVDRVPAYAMNLTADEEARVTRLLEENILICGLASVAVALVLGNLERPL